MWRIRIGLKKECEISLSPSPCFVRNQFLFFLHSRSLRLLSRISFHPFGLGKISLWCYDEDQKRRRLQENDCFWKSMVGMSVQREADEDGKISREEVSGHGGEGDIKDFGTVKSQWCLVLIIRSFIETDWELVFSGKLGMGLYGAKGVHSGWSCVP